MLETDRQTGSGWDTDQPSKPHLNTLVAFPMASPAAPVTPCQQRTSQHEHPGKFPHPTSMGALMNLMI